MIKPLHVLALLALAGCATDYQPQGFTGGYDDYLTAPDVAVVTFHGNGYTAAERVVEMAGLRCAEVTLQHGYRYFVMIGASDVSGSFSFTTPGSAHTYGNVYGGGFSATTTVNPPRTFSFYKPGILVSIKMSNDEKSLEPLGVIINGQRARPQDAAFLAQSLRAHLGVKGN